VYRSSLTSKFTNQILRPLDESCDEQLMCIGLLLHPNLRTKSSNPGRKLTIEMANSQRTVKAMKYQLVSALLAITSVVQADIVSDGYQYWTAPTLSKSQVFTNGISGEWDENKTDYVLLGWHSNFSESSAGGSAQCTGKYQAVSQQPFDTSGQTCYVNPVADSSISPGVIWFSKLPPYANNTLRASYNGIYTWYAVFNASRNYTDYMPGPCQDFGACECGPFDEIRAGWIDPKNGDVLTFGTTANDTVISLGVFGTSFAADDCNIKLTTILTNDAGQTVGRFAVLQAGLSEAPVIPAGSLTGAPTPSNASLPSSSGFSLRTATLIATSFVALTLGLS